MPPHISQLVWHSFGYPVADLFTSAENALCPLWFSLQSADAPPLGVDAMAHKIWPQGLLCAFPLVHLLPLPHPSGGPWQPTCQVVSRPDPDFGRGTSGPPRRRRRSMAGRGDPPVPPRPVRASAGLEIERESLIDVGLSASVVCSIQGARAASTVMAY